MSTVEYNKPMIEIMTELLAQNRMILEANVQAMKVLGSMPIAFPEEPVGLFDSYPGTKSFIG